MIGEGTLNAGCAAFVHSRKVAQSLIRGVKLCKISRMCTAEVHCTPVNPQNVHYLKHRAPAETHILTIFGMDKATAIVIDDDDDDCAPAAAATPVIRQVLPPKVNTLNKYLAPECMASEYDKLLHKRKEDEATQQDAAPTPDPPLQRHKPLVRSKSFHNEDELRSRQLPVERYKFLDTEAECSEEETEGEEAADTPGSLVDFVIPDGDLIAAADRAADDYAASLHFAAMQRREDEERERRIMQEVLPPATEADENEVIQLISEDEAPSAADSAKRAEPSPTERMLLEEEEQEEGQREEPPAKAARSEEEGDAEMGEEVTDPDKKYDRWLWTWFPGNNPYRPDALLKGAKYMTYQEEQTKKELLHLQGYIRFKWQKPFASVLKLFRKLMPEGSLWIGRALKCEKACIRYCNKKKSRVGAPKEFGEAVASKGQQGHRSDLDGVVKAVQDGQSFVQIAVANPVECIHYHAGIKVLISATRQLKWQHTKRPTLQVMVLYGETNTGKSHRVRELEGEHLYDVEPGRDPFGNYESEDSILFDEFGMGEKWDINLMKRCLENYPQRVTVRYADKWAAWKRVYIISNDPPQMWFALASVADKRAFWRRVTRIENILCREDDPDFDPIRHEISESGPVFANAVAPLNWHY